MPIASPRCPPRTPAPLQIGEQEFIREAVKRLYGDDAIIRTYSPSPEQLALHVETSAHHPDIKTNDCLGLLMTRIDRSISIEITQRGALVRGNAKLAYRQGVIL